MCERRRRRCHATRCSRLLERMWIRKAVVLPGSKWPDASTQQASWPWAIATTTTFGCAHTGERYGTQSKRLAWLGRFLAPLSPHVLKLSPLSHTSPCGRRRSTEPRERTAAIAAAFLSAAVGACVFEREAGQLSRWCVNDKGVQVQVRHLPCGWVRLRRRHPRPARLRWVA